MFSSRRANQYHLEVVYQNQYMDRYMYKNYKALG